MKKVGLTPTGWAHKRFKNRLIKLGIDVTSMPGSNWNKNIKVGHRKNIKTYLTINSDVCSSFLRKRLIQEGLKENKCEICSIFEWQGKKLPLQLDHINGNKFDNRLKNLRILCPNCHAQTTTHSKRKS